MTKSKAEIPCTDITTTEFVQWLGGLEDAELENIIGKLYHLFCHNESEEDESETDESTSLQATEFNFHDLVNGIVSAESSWHAISQKYKVSFLGGRHSINFLVENLETPSEQFVVRLHTSWGNSTQHLESLKNTPYAETIVTPSINRAVKISTSEEIILQALNYYPNKDVESFSLTLAHDDDRLWWAKKIFTEMACFLDIALRNKITHTDMKNANWIVKGEGLGIVDTKGLIPTTDDQMVVYRKDGFDVVYSDLMGAPELRTIEYRPAKAEPASVFILGKNIYLFLTGQRLDEWDNDESEFDSNEASSFDFTHDVFNTAAGKVFRTVIESSVTLDVKKRSTLNRVLELLASISIPEPKSLSTLQLEPTSSTETQATGDLLAKRTKQTPFAVPYPKVKTKASGNLISEIAQQNEHTNLSELKDTIMTTVGFKLFKSTSQSEDAGSEKNDGLIKE